VTATSLLCICLGAKKKHQCKDQGTGKYGNFFEINSKNVHIVPEKCMSVGREREHLGDGSMGKIADR